MKLPFGLGKDTPRENTENGTRAGQVNDTNAGAADEAATTAFPTSEGGRAEPQKVGAPRGRGRRGGRGDKTDGAVAGAPVADQSMTSETADPETTVITEASEPDRARGTADSATSGSATSGAGASAGAVAGAAGGAATNGDAGKSGTKADAASSRAPFQDGTRETAADETGWPEKAASSGVSGKTAVAGAAGAGALGAAGGAAASKATGSHTGDAAASDRASDRAVSDRAAADDAASTQAMPAVDPAAEEAPKKKGLFGSKDKDKGKGKGDDATSGSGGKVAAGAAAGAAVGAGAMAAHKKHDTSDSTTTGTAHTAAHGTDQDTMNSNSTEAFSTAGNDTTAFPAAGAGYGDDYATGTDAYAYDGQVAPVEDTPAAAAPVKVRRGTADFGLFALRVVVGAFLLLHSLRIVFGTFNGPGTDAFGQILGDSGFAQGSLLAIIMGVTMLVGAVMLIIGLAVPLATAALLAVVSLSALVLIAAPGNFTLLGGSDLSGAPSGGLEIHVLYAAALFALLFAGGGKWGLDFSRKYATAPRFSGLLWLILAIAAVAALWYFLHGGNPLADASGAAAA